MTSYMKVYAQAKVVMEGRKHWTSAFFFVNTWLDHPVSLTSRPGTNLRVGDFVVHDIPREEASGHAQAAFLQLLI